ncbi:MAG: efflux RND transporter periplasmic adaptor subunit [Alphaproteobacteria bacterium]|nr:efflux RND transporter periplasmic adaptor subunit [Alphaproteobacteria bacterium]MBV9964832.1 efflux RND transporter periplasmic adaptor subunit [Alphaproteobacteria bacterium]
MDGEIKFATADSETADALVHARDTLGRPAAVRPKTVRWFAIVGLLLLLVLGALYGFNRYRAQAIATFFANNKPPPAQIAAITAQTQNVPRFASAIGSLAAVHQVTITPEVGGKLTEIMFTPGATVKAGDPLVQLNDAPERGDLANYEAQARYAAATLQRNSHLASNQFASRDTVDQNQSQLDQAKAQIAKTEALIGQKLIRAPFAGRLGVRQADLGQYVSPGAAIVTLTDLKELYVNFTLASTWRGQIALGQKVNITADAFPARTFTGTITTIEPQIRNDTRTMMAQATLQNSDEALMPGMFVNTAVVLPAESDRVVLPETAVDYTLYGDSVYVIREEGADANGKPILKAHRTPVKVGQRWDGKAVINDGVQSGDRVVAAGQVKLQDGAQVIVTGNPPPQPPAKPTLH